VRGGFRWSGEVYLVWWCVLWGVYVWLFGDSIVVGSFACVIYGVWDVIIVSISSGG